MPRQQTETMEQSYEIIKVLNNISRENALVRLAGRLGCFSHLGAATLLLAVDEDHPDHPTDFPTHANGSYLGRNGRGCASSRAWCGTN